MNFLISKHFGHMWSFQGHVTSIINSASWSILNNNYANIYGYLCLKLVFKYPFLIFAFLNIDKIFIFYHSELPVQEIQARSINFWSINFFKNILFRIFKLVRLWKSVRSDGCSTHSFFVFSKNAIPVTWSNSC